MCWTFWRASGLDGFSASFVSVLAQVRAWHSLVADCLGGCESLCGMWVESAWCRRETFFRCRAWQWAGPSMASVGPSMASVRNRHHCREATNSGVLQSEKLFATIVSSTFAVKTLGLAESEQVVSPGQPARVSEVPSGGRVQRCEVPEWGVCL